MFKKSQILMTTEARVGLSLKRSANIFLNFRELKKILSFCFLSVLTLTLMACRSHTALSDDGDLADAKRKQDPCTMQSCGEQERNVKFSLEGHSFKMNEQLYPGWFVQLRGTVCGWETAFSFCNTLAELRFEERVYITESECEAFGDVDPNNRKLCKLQVDKTRSSGCTILGSGYRKLCADVVCLCSLNLNRPLPSPKTTDDQN